MLGVNPRCYYLYFASERLYTSPKVTSRVALSGPTGSVCIPSITFCWGRRAASSVGASGAAGQSGLEFWAGRLIRPPFCCAVRLKPWGQIPAPGALVKALKGDSIAI